MYYQIYIRNHYSLATKNLAQTEIGPSRALEKKEGSDQAFLKS